MPMTDAEIHKARELAQRHIHWGSLECVGEGECGVNGTFNVITIFAALLLVAGISADGRHYNYHHCTSTGGSANTPRLFDISEIYSCDEGTVEIAGRVEQAIEYGYVYETELGRPSRESPHPATTFDYNNYKWCPSPSARDGNQKVRCGDKPTKCWDGKLSTWDAQWQGYSCVTPDHTGTKP